MSHEAVSWALYDAPMLTTDAGRPDSTARYVLAVLAEKADPYGANSYPSTLTIQYATGYDHRTVQRALLRLERGELIARDGISKYGTTRWKLAMPRTRPETDLTQLQAEAETVKQGESAARQARRYRAKHAHDEPLPIDDVSGTQTPGHPVDSAVDNSPVRDTECRTHRQPSGAEALPADIVRDANSRRPGRKVPDVRDAAPPEPPREPPLTTPGGTLPPDPLRPELPPVVRNEQDHSPSTAADQPGDQQGDHRPRAREQLRLIDGNPHATPNERGIWPAPVTTQPATAQGYGFCLACHHAGHITLATDPVNGTTCAYHQRTATA